MGEEEVGLKQWAETYGVFLKAGAEPAPVEVQGRDDPEARVVHLDNPGRARVFVCRFCGEKLLRSGYNQVADHAVRPVARKGCSQISVAALTELGLLGVAGADEKLREVQDPDAARGAGDKAAAAGDVTPARRPRKREAADSPAGGQVAGSTGGAVEATPRRNRRGKEATAAKKEEEAGKKDDEEEKKEEEMGTDEDSSNEADTPKKEEADSESDSKDSDSSLDEEDRARLQAEIDAPAAVTSGAPPSADASPKAKAKAKGRAKAKAGTRARRQEEPGKEQDATMGIPVKEEDENIKEKGKDKKEKKDKKDKKENKDKKEKKDKKHKKDKKDKRDKKGYSDADLATPERKKKKGAFETSGLGAGKSLAEQGAEFWGDPEIAAFEPQVRNPRTPRNPGTPRMPGTPRIPGTSRMPGTPSWGPHVPLRVAQGWEVRFAPVERLKVEMTNRIEIPLCSEEADYLEEPLAEGLRSRRVQVAIVSSSSVTVDTDVQGSRAVVEARGPTECHNGALLLRAMLEARNAGGTLVDSQKRHPFRTSLRLPVKLNLDWLSEMCVRLGVMTVAAGELQSAKVLYEELGIGSDVELHEADGPWTDARILEVRGHIWKVRGDADGVIREVPSRMGRPKGSYDGINTGSHDLLAIFGDRHRRARALLELAAYLLEKHPGFEFGDAAAAELGHDPDNEDDWGTSVLPIKDDFLLAYYQERLPKYHAGLCHAAVHVIDRTFYASGTREDRDSARTVLLADEEESFMWKSSQEGKASTPSGQRYWVRRTVAQAWRACDHLTLPHEHMNAFMEDQQEGGRLSSVCTDFGVMVLGVSEDIDEPNRGFQVGEEVEIEFRYKLYPSRVMEILPDGKLRIELLEDGWQQDTDTKYVKHKRETGSLLIVGGNPLKRAQARLRLMSMVADVDPSMTFEKELSVCPEGDELGPEEIALEVAGADREWWRRAAKRVARAARCGVEVVGQRVVVFGNREARQRAQRLLEWAAEEKRNPNREVRVEDKWIGAFEGGVLLFTPIHYDLRPYLSEEVVEDLESASNAFVFLRDQYTGRTFKHFQTVEARRRKTGNFEKATFVRKVVGRDLYKVNFGEDNTKDEEDVHPRDVRPFGSAGLDFMAFGLDEGLSGETGVKLALGRVVELLRDARGQQKGAWGSSSYAATSGQQDSWGSYGTASGKDAWGSHGAASGQGSSSSWSGSKWSSSDQSWKSSGDAQRGKAQDGSNWKGNTWSKHEDSNWQQSSRTSSWGKNDRWSSNAGGEDETQTASTGSATAVALWGQASVAAEHTAEPRETPAGNIPATPRGMQIPMTPVGPTRFMQPQTPFRSSLQPLPDNSLQSEEPQATGLQLMAVDRPQPKTTPVPLSVLQQAGVIIPGAPMLQASALAAVSPPRLQGDAGAPSIEQLEEMWRTLPKEAFPSRVHEWEAKQADLFPGMPPLPPGWLRCISRSERQMYFLNRNSNLTTFDEDAVWTS